MFDTTASKLNQAYRASSIVENMEWFFQELIYNNPYLLWVLYRLGQERPLNSLAVTYLLLTKGYKWCLSKVISSTLGQKYVDTNKMHFSTNLLIDATRLLECQRTL